jgi:hypothetical protein
MRMQGSIIIYLAGVRISPSYSGKFTTHLVEVTRLVQLCKGGLEWFREEGRGMMGVGFDELASWEIIEFL